MYKTFKTRAASFSCQHLALAFMLFMSFFFNDNLAAQTEAHLDVFIRLTRDVDNPTNYVRCNISVPMNNTVTKSYAFKVNVINKGGPCSSINVDFGDGQGGREISTTGETVLTINYQDYGSVPLTVALPNAGDHNATWNGTFKRFRHRAIESVNYQSPDETVSVSGINMHIKYAPSNSQHKLKKPIIFAEGIDFPIDVTYDMTGKPAKVGSFGWDTFITGMVDDATSSDNVTFAGLPDFVNQMLGEGYDIVFCDFQDGTALIEENGRGLIAVINEVNNRKKSGLTFKQTCYANTLIGASMGGQVARWALKTMENENTDHDCSLYYSMDSPHKGANIPLSLQAFLWYGANFGPSDGNKAKLLAKWTDLNKPAAKQLVAFHLGTHGEHTTYMNMMNQLGYPQRTRNVASANGSGVGQDQGYSNNAGLVNASGYEKFRIGSFKVFALSLNASGANTIAKFDRVFEGPTIDNYLSIPTGHMLLERQGNNAVVLKGSEVNIPLASLLTYSSYSTSQTINFGKDMTMWDNCSGGNRDDIRGEFLESIEKGLLDYNGVVEGPSGKQCFIPTVSALDLATDNMSTNADNFVGIRSNPNPGSTPFKSVFMASNNEAHVFMSSDLLTFARNEIVANTKISCGGLMTTDPNIEKEMAPGVGGVSPGVNPGVGRTGGMKVIGAEQIGTGLQTREGVAIPVKDDGDNKDN